VIYDSNVRHKSEQDAGGTRVYGNTTNGIHTATDIHKPLDQQLRERTSSGNYGKYNKVSMAAITVDKLAEKTNSRVRSFPVTRRCR